MKGSFFIALCFLAAGCNYAGKKKATPVYDEATLKAFVLNTHSIVQNDASEKLDSILTSSSSDSAILHQAIAFLETPFSNPNSSFRNQKLYEKLLQVELKSNWYNGYEKKIAADRIKLLQQNNVGDTANDFTYLTPATYKKRMYDIKADYVLLYFNNPECNACKEMKEALVASAIINQKVKTGELKILSIYTDKDEKLWLDHLNQYPQQWIQGRDENEFLYRNKVYDLRAIPTLYLLDEHKKVLLKDATLPQIEKKLASFSTDQTKL